MAGRAIAPYAPGPTAPWADRPAVPLRNRLIGALPPDEFAELAPHLELVSVRAGHALLRIGAPVEHVYFPEGAVATLGVAAGDDIAAIGQDGLIGLSAVLGDDVAFFDGVVRVPGRALRVRAATLRRLAAEVPPLGRVLGFYTHALLLQIAHAGSCGRSHALEKRLAALLLWLRDQAGSDHLPLTHEHLARLLGTARRASVTEATLALRARGLLRAQRGGLTIEDRAGLLAGCCGCYAIVRAHFDRMAGGHGVRR